MRKGFKLHRVFIVFLFTIGLFFGSVSSSQAFTWFWERNNAVEEQTKSFEESLIRSKEEGIPSQGSHTANTSQFILLDINSRLVGVDEEQLSRESGYSPSEIKVLTDRYGNGVINDVGSAVALLYNQPASVKTYVADILESAHVIPKAQAQGLGFASLDPILETWKVFRNVAYLFFVVIFLIIGFMIMFRHKISGQTVVTAQQAIPSILVALVFVTFSYAIAGFLIDLMYLLMYLMIGVFQPGDGVRLLGKNFLTLGGDLISGTSGTEGAWDNVNQAVSGLVEEIIPGDDDGAINKAFGWIGGLTMGIIVSVAILIGVFKLFFELLKTYITIIILIVTAPLSLMASAIPGKNNFGDWIRKVFGNLLAFPMVLFALILYEMFTANDLEAGGFLPPFLIGRGQPGVIMTLVGIGIILVIPEMIKEMKKALKVDGGIFESLAQAAGKNLAAGKPAIPLATGAIGGGVGLANAAKSSLGKESLRSFLTNSALKGRVIGKDKDGNVIRKGGLLPGASSGLKFGSTAMTKFDQLKEGKFFGAQDSSQAIVDSIEKLGGEQKTPKKQVVPGEVAETKTTPHTEA